MLRVIVLRHSHPISIQLFMTNDNHFLQVNLTNANLEGALTTGNTSFKGSIITGAGKQKR